MLSTTSILMTMIGSFSFSICYLVLAKAILFTVDELNQSLVNIREAIEDLEYQDSVKVKSLRRLFERTDPISGSGMFEVRILTKLGGKLNIIFLAQQVNSNRHDLQCYHIYHYHGSIQTKFC